MDSSHLEQALVELRRERTETEHQMASLQQRLDAVRKAEEGLGALLQSEFRGGPQARQTAGPGHPVGKEAATLVLQSDTSRFWTHRENWEEQVRLGWAEPTEDARNAVRAALKRLRLADDAHIRFLEGPVQAYQWTDEPQQSALPGAPPEGTRETPVLNGAVGRP